MAKKTRIEQEQQQEQRAIGIPKEIIFEILLRLPCRELIEKFRFVSKQWCSIIHDRRFINSHLHHTKQQSSSSSSELAVVSTTDGYTFSLSSLQYQLSHCSCQIQYSCQIHGQGTRTQRRGLSCSAKDLFTTKNALAAAAPNKSARVIAERINSVNGLVCFESTGGFVHVCNPMTGEVVTAPRNPMIEKCPSTMVLGLGFCPLSSEYKAVLVYYENGMWVPDKETLNAEVLTLGRDHSWRRVKQLRGNNNNIRCHLLCPSGKVASIDGMMYWNVRTRFGNGFTETPLLRFKVTDETFDVVVVPVLTKELCVHVAEFRAGRLSLVSFVPPSSSSFEVHKMEVWMVKDDDMKDLDLTSSSSWVKEYVISLGMIESLPSMDNGEVLCIFEEDKVLVLFDEEVYALAFFDITNGTLIGVYKDDDRVFSGIPYLPTLETLRLRLPQPQPQPQPQPRN